MPPRINALNNITTLANVREKILLGMWPAQPTPSLLPSFRYDEMKNPYFTFLAPDNYYATTDDIDPQLMAETVKSFKSAAMGDSLKMSPATKAAVENTLRNLRLQQR